MRYSADMQKIVDDKIKKAGSQLRLEKLSVCAG
jgi:hypothetical protein